MKCEFDYCIYNRDFYCILKETSLNSLGICDECILVTISDKDLKMMKERQLRELEERLQKDGYDE